MFQKTPYSRMYPDAREERIEKILESLSLQGIESWSE